MTVWLFGLLAGCVMVANCVRYVTGAVAAVGVARAQSESVRAAAEAQVSSAVFPPAQWVGGDES
jgi:uncharacterized membrane protein YbhN (UPF0104 family)